MKTESQIFDLNTPIGAFHKLNDFRPVFLLENVEREGKPGRYSFIGLDPVETIKYDCPDNISSLEEAPFLGLLRNELNKLPVRSERKIRYPTGFMGVTSFELAREFLDVPSHKPQDIGLHDALLVAPRMILAFDHLNHSVTFLQTDQDETDKTLISEIRKALESGEPRRPSGGSFSRAEACMSPETYKKLIRKAKESILDGKIFQVVLSICLTGETDIEPFNIYRALRHINPSPYHYFLNLDGIHVLGSSPEMLVRLTDNTIQLRPMGGTRPRSEDPREDKSLENELISDDKEIAEHVMRVDQARNDCAKVCRTGSVTVPEFRTVEHFSHVMHMVSRITGEKRPDVDLCDVFNSVFPAGSVSGIPKKQALNLIYELEEEPRGPYAGGVGFFSPDGTMDQAIAIRTMVIKENQYRIQGGSGIVADSDPEKELEEVYNKTGALMQALEIARDKL